MNLSRPREREREASWERAWCGGGTKQRARWQETCGQGEAGPRAGPRSEGEVEAGAPALEAIGSAWGGTGGDAGIQVHPLERARAGPAEDWPVAWGGVGGAAADRGSSLWVAGDNVS